MKVLLVDDEPRVVEGLERMLLELAGDWEVTCATSGVEALALLEAEPYDAVVSDMRMPGMDGAELLGRVQRSHPRVIRFVLSGQTARPAGLEAVRVAHQFLAKPCSAEVLVGSIQRAHELSERIASDRVRALVTGMRSLPAAPSLYRELQACMMDANADMRRVASIVEKDPAMTVKLLAIANSAFFARAAAVSEVRAALVRLGLEIVAALVLVVGAFDGLSGHMHPREVDMLQKRAFRTAMLARRFADSADVADACAAALLAEIGQLVLAAAVGDLARSARERARRTKRPLSIVEDELIGVNHRVIGAYLVELWGLPQRVVTAIASHGDLRSDPHRGPGVTAAVHAAVCLARGEPVDEAYFADIGAADVIARWKTEAAALLDGEDS